MRFLLPFAKGCTTGGYMNKFLLPGILIAGAFAIGLAFKFGTKFIDHPVEQAAETVLKQHGIDVDFSDEKKNTDQNEGEEDDYSLTSDICGYTE